MAFKVRKHAKIPKEHRKQHKNWHSLTRFHAPHLCHLLKNIFITWRNHLVTVKMQENVLIIHHISKRQIAITRAGISILIVAASVHDKLANFFFFCIYQKMLFSQMRYSFFFKAKTLNADGIDLSSTGVKGSLANLSQLQPHVVITLYSCYLNSYPVQLLIMRVI